MERVAKFLKDAETYYLATVEGDQPRVRPFGTAHIFEEKMYSADDGNTEVFYFKNATATFSSFTHEPEVVKF